VRIINTKIPAPKMSSVFWKPCLKSKFHLPQMLAPFPFSRRALLSPRNDRIFHFWEGIFWFLIISDPWQGNLVENVVSWKKDKEYFFHRLSMFINP
jgi:hypothetical protein